MEAQACSRSAELLNKWASALPSYALETMERAARYGSRAVRLFEACLAESDAHALAQDERLKRQAELESALYWEALNHATVCGLPGGSLDKAACAARVRDALGRLRDLLAERGVGDGDADGARLAFAAGVFDFNLAASAAPGPAGGPACDGVDGGGAAADRLVRRALAGFREAHRLWAGAGGRWELDTAAAATMVAASLARLGEAAEAAEWAERDYDLRARIQASARAR